MHEVGIRVCVWAGDGQTYLGEGTYLGESEVHFFRFPDGHLSSMPDAREVPPENVIAGMEEQGAEHIIMPYNPVIELDTGKIVYGCQVWWRPEKGDAK